LHVIAVELVSEDQFVLRSKRPIFITLTSHSIPHSEIFLHFVGIVRII